MAAPLRIPVRTRVVTRWQQIHQQISRANGYNYDVTAERTHRWRRITPQLATPATSIFPGAEQVDGHTPRGMAQYTIALSITTAFVASLTDLQGYDDGLTPDQYGDLFIADIEEAVGVDANSVHKAFSFDVVCPRYHDDDPRVQNPDLQTYTFWGQEAESFVMASDAMKGKIFGEINWMLFYKRSVFSPYAV